MKVKFWGVRGSVPSPGISTTYYGGNTCCVSIELSTGKVLVLDAGTGIRELGKSLTASNTDIFVLVTHDHWDHIQGFPFFAPLYQSGRKIYIFPTPQGKDTLYSLVEQMSGAHFPVSPDNLPAQYECISQDVYGFLRGHGFSVSRIATNHPGGGYGYRVENNGRSVVYLTDNELEPPDVEATGFDKFVRFCKYADVLIHDAQYTKQEMSQKRGWGHSHVGQACRLAAAAEVKHLVLFHHDPDRTDEELNRIQESARSQFQENGYNIQCTVAFEGLVLDLRRKRETVIAQPDVILEPLQQVPFLAPLTPEQRVALVFEAILREYASGTDIVREGSYGNSFYIIESGLVTVYKVLEEKVVEIAHLGPGAFFGEAALVGEPRSASVRAKTRARMLEIPRSSFKQLLGENPDVAFAVMRELSRRLYETDQRVIDDLQQFNMELAHAYDATIEGWARALELRDLETKGHSRRVTQMTLHLAHTIGMNGDQLMHVRRGALLHDIGKMSVPDEILLKPGPLTSDEWEIMRKHPVYAYKLLSSIAFLQPALDIPYYHHEKWDGSGYPRGLKREQIPLPARMFAVVDVWDALRSDRPYRSAWPEEKVYDYIESHAGGHFDPEIVSVFLDLEGDGFKD